MSTKTTPVICSICNLEFTDQYDIDDICTNKESAAFDCTYHPRHRTKFKLHVVGKDFAPIENDPQRLEAMQELIDSGKAWHPDIDKDGHTGRQANNLIERGILRAPCSHVGERYRHMFDVCQRFGIDHKARP